MPLPRIIVPRPKIPQPGFHIELLAGEAVARGQMRGGYPPDRCRNQPANSNPAVMNLLS